MISLSVCYTGGGHFESSLSNMVQKPMLIDLNILEHRTVLEVSGMEQTAVYN